MQRFSPIRAAVTMLIVACAMLALIGRVIFLQTYGRQQTIRRAERQQHQDEILPSRRGSIWDSVGLQLAGTVQTTSLFIDPVFFQEQLNDDGETSDQISAHITQLANLLDETPAELNRELDDHAESRFVRVADNISPDMKQAIEKLKLPGVGFTPVNERCYPMGSIAAHLLGGVGTEGKGLDGLELKYEKVLAGRDGYKRTMKDARRRPIAVNAEDYLPPQNGQHLVLTIDSNIQMIAEQQLAEGCEKYHAKRGEVIIMDPLTGNVLAMANWPTFNPQNLGDSTPDMRRNRCLTDPYEPGSTIKPFIVGPSIAAKLTRPDQVFPVPASGSYKSQLRTKLVTDTHGYGPLALWDVLVKSSNIGMTMLGEQIGKQNVYNALSTFHFGQPTGIDLLGEDGGLIKPVAKWGNSDLVSAVQGYSIMVTPLQLARGMCAYANGGHLMQPRIVEGVLDDDGNVIERAAKPTLASTPEVIDPATAAQVRRILADVPVRGTATAARSKTWNIFGKTGTAHISGGKDGYNEDKYTSSFVGGAPYENPRLVIAMIIHEPDRKLAYYGGTVSGPSASKALERCLSYMQVPASPPLAPPPPQIAKLLWGFDPKLYAHVASITD